MKQLLQALESFSRSPEAVTDNLLGVYSSVAKMEWDELMGVAGALQVLKDEAWRLALARNEKTALDDPTFKRLDSCMSPIVVRAGILIAQAPRDQKKGLIEAVTGRSGFVDFSTRKRWLEAI